MSRPTRRFHVPSAIRPSPVRIDPDRARQLVEEGAVLVDVRRKSQDPPAPRDAIRIPPDEIPELIAAHDVVLVPSLAEGFGVAAAEAIASGRWVVARAVGGLPEVVTDGVNGFLVSTDDELAEALGRIPDYDPELVAGTASRFDVENYWAGMAAIWSDVLETRRRASQRRSA